MAEQPAQRYLCPGSHEGRANDGADGAHVGPQTRRVRALQQKPGRPGSLEGPLALLSAQREPAGPAPGAVSPRVIPHPLGLGPPEALAASVWEIR